MSSISMFDIPERTEQYKRVFVPACMLFDVTLGRVSVQGEG